MDTSFKKLIFILGFCQFSSACSIDMIAGMEDDPQIKNEATLNILPAFRTHLSANEDPRLSEQFASRNQAALLELKSNIRLLNRSNHAVRHTLVTQYNNSNFKYTNYIKNWKLSLELYANSQYPKSLAYQPPIGNVLVDVAITKSGKLYSYDILLSTGTPKINAVINEIIHHTAPFYAPLSSEIQTDTDVLHIAQMWQFRHFKQRNSLY